MRKYIICNWKENPQSLAEAEKLFDATVESAQVLGVITVICPPVVFIEELAKRDGGVPIGAQNCSADEGGAHTGEISVPMLQNLGVRFVIVGHSERRAMGETDEAINRKVLKLLEHNMHPILCVGEKNKTDDRQKIVSEQLQKDLYGAPRDKLNQVLIAYEPIWAIGTGDAETPEHASEILRIIRSILNLDFGLQTSELLYGGSVNSENAGSFLMWPEISGLLVGGASLDSKEISKIISVAKEQ